MSNNISREKVIEKDQVRKARKIKRIKQVQHFEMFERTKEEMNNLECSIIIWRNKPFKERHVISSNIAMRLQRRNSDCQYGKRVYNRLMNGVDVPSDYDKELRSVEHQ